jgi:uncharacterized membrane protein
MSKEPAHFSKEDIFYSFFGALFVGIAFMSKGIVIDISRVLTASHIVSIIIVTSLLITVQIYYVGYRRVPLYERKQRTPGEFWAKRFFTIYLVSLLAATLLLYMYNVNYLIGSQENIAKAIIALAMPCSLGATFSDLFRKIKF